MKRMTFDGRVVSLDEISHEHLSNIYWFNKLINAAWNDVSGWKAYEHKLVTKVLAEKWNSVLLNYSPHRNSKEEIKLLDERGYLEWYFDENGIKKAKIFEEPLFIHTSTPVRERRQIGELCEIEWLRHDKINKLLV